MGTRPMLCGVATVEVNQDRYDELLHKEAKLEALLNLIRTGWELKPDILQIFTNDMEGET